MRATHQEQTGGVGVSEVSAAFERLDWGIAENARHDLGTDLFGMARDARLFDLGLIVGIQVKAGAWYFSEPATDEDGIVRGWWFRDRDRSHIDTWLKYAIPHLVVLHDLETRSSYWVHVTADAVVSTGQGAKILVPAANRVDEGCRAALLHVAASARPNVSWEGSAWTGAPALTPDESLRYALVAPRLVAPHPNAGHDRSITAAEAVALLMQARLQDFAIFSKTHPDVPALEEAAHSASWEWRFVSALGDRVTTDETDNLGSLIDDAPDAACRSAATVAASAALMEQNKADDAIALLRAVLTTDDAAPIDNAWLRLQLARASAEVGALLEARDMAAEVQAIRTTHPDDVTASAIAGTAARLIFATSEWGQRDVSAVITGADTTTTWWRAQTLAWGLADLAEREFRAWAREKSLRLGGSDDAHNQLFAAALAANHLGSQGDWRHTSALRGMDTLLRLSRSDSSTEAQGGLSLLRQSGDDGALKLAVNRLCIDGPAAAIRLEASEIQLDFSTRTTGPTDLTLLRHGGDVVDEEMADRSVAWLLETMADPASFISRTTPSYLVALRLVETLGPLVRASSAESRRAVIDAIRGLHGQADQLMATAWGEVVRAIPLDDWDKQAALELVERVDSHDGALRHPLLSVAARFSTEIRAALVDEMREGSLDALAALGSVADLSDEDVEPLIEGLAGGVQSTIASAQAGSFGYPQYDPAQSLALLNAWHLEVAQWDPLLDLLHDQHVRAEQKAAAFGTLASLESKLPAEIRPRLRDAAMGAASSADGDEFWMFPGHGDAKGAATALAELLDDEVDGSSTKRFVDLLAGEPHHRLWAANLASRLRKPEDVGFLAVLAQDTEPEVRAAAAAGLAQIVADGSEDSTAASALQRAAADPGVMVPKSIALVLSATSELPAVASHMLEGLRHHISASVRLIAGNADAGLLA